MISFRVTVEEYERFRKLCFQRGLRNVSEVVRLAVNHLLKEEAASPDEVSLFARVAELESRLTYLEEHLVNPHSCPDLSTAHVNG